MIKRFFSLLEVGARGNLLLRQEFVRSRNITKPLRILYLSDLHFGAFGGTRVVKQLLELCSTISVDIILLGGDLVDHKGGLPLLFQLVTQLSESAPVYAISGNHDAFVSVEVVRDTVCSAGGRWLIEASFHWPPEKPEITIHGHVGAEVVPGIFTVLCGHYPNCFPKALSRGFQLVFAGHLHGGQAVLMTHKGILYPAGFFYHWNGLRFENGIGTLIVSRGAHDTLPLRWNCPREAILCEIA